MSPSTNIETGDRRPAVAIFSRDQAILDLIARCLTDSWVIESLTDPHEWRALLQRPGVRIVVIDDEAVDESSRGWLLEQVRRRAPQALVAYIAAVHSAETERRARSYNVQYYTSKPMDRERTIRVLRSFESVSR